MDRLCAKHARIVPEREQLEAVKLTQAVCLTVADTDRVLVRELTCTPKLTFERVAFVHAPKIYFYMVQHINDILHLSSGRLRPTG